MPEAALPWAVRALGLPHSEGQGEGLTEFDDAEGEEEEMSKVGLVVLVVGLLGVLLGGGVLLVSLLLPVLTDGRTSWDEAMLGIIPGALLLLLSLVVTAAGAVVLIMKRKKQPLAANAGR